MQELPNDYAIAGKTFGPVAKIGIAVRKGDTNIKAAVTKALAAIKADGALDQVPMQDRE